MWMHGLKVVGVQLYGTSLIISEIIFINYLRVASFFCKNYFCINRYDYNFGKDVIFLRSPAWEVVHKNENNANQLHVNIYF